MENVPAFTTAIKQRMPKTLSVGSLDVGQLIAANVVQNSSLLSESVTYASDLSDAFSETLPAFPMRPLPGIATVSLGEHLKMFPGTTAKTGSRIMLASPTSPRLQSMCKECLSISKWAEYSMGWDAPGHIPWENRIDYTTRKWLPEGSLFSSESFARALFQARNWQTGIGSDLKLNSDMLEMMRELHNLRSYFAETLRDGPDLDFDLSCPHRPPVPALVVSTSYVTLPLTLESSQNLSHDSSSAIVSRQGREEPPPLTVLDEKVSCSVLPSDAATSSLGCHASDNLGEHPKVFTVVNPEPALCIEDMITHLRLQCSNISLSPSHPIEDTSWNSQSPDNETKKPKPSKPVNKQTTPEPPLEPHHDKESSAPAPTVGSESRLRGKLNQSKINYKKRTSTDLSSPQPALVPKSSKSGTPRNGPAVATRVIAQNIPRSAMVKALDNRSQKPYKMVRFALPKSEVEEALVGSTLLPLMRQSLSTTDTNNIPNSKAASLPDDPPKTIRLVPPVRASSKTDRKETDSIPISDPPLRHSTVRTRSVNITPFRKIALARESVNLKAPRTESVSQPRVRRSHTLGGHPFSRIIRRPILALKENKRATIAVDSAAFKTTADEKRRVSAATVQGSSKKNRIRSLLTRFK